MIDFLPYKSQLTIEDLELAKESFHLKVFRRAEVIMPIGPVCTQLFFIKKGLVYAQTADETILYYEFENHAFTDIESFLSQSSSAISIICAEDDTHIVSISRKDLQHLVKQSHSWALWAIKFLEGELLRLTGYYESLRQNDASQRYEELINLRPDILQRIPLGHIASYLGISQVSLSRIRGGVQKK